MDEDRYVRGEDAGSSNDEAKHRSRVRAPYRKLVGIIWVVGVALLLLAPLAGVQGIAGVYVATHVFLAGFVRWDLLALRRQGLDVGFSRHLWFAATLVLPLVAPAYYFYSGRRVETGNERRGLGVEREEGDGTEEDGEASPAGGER